MTPLPENALGSILLEMDMPGEMSWRHAAADLVARPWLAKKVAAFTRDPRGGGILLVEGKPGSGKTGFVRERLHALKNERPVAHFISLARHANNPAHFFGSLSAQLRRKHRVCAPKEPPAGWHGNRALAAAQQFFALLRELSEYLQAATPPRREVIWIDALNVAYGEGGTFRSPAGVLHELIEAAQPKTADALALPPGIFLVVTSCDDPQLDPLRRRCAGRIDLDNEKDAAMQRNIADDIARFFEKVLGPGHAPVGIEAIRGNFLYARFWADTFSEGGPAREPTSLDELLGLVLARVASRWRDVTQAGEAELDVLDDFGLLACTREPLTPPLVRALFEETRAERILELCRVAKHLFCYPGDTPRDDAQLFFFHRYIAEFLLKPDDDLPASSPLPRWRLRLAEKLQAADRDLSRAWHAALAAACQRGVTRRDERVRDYAVRHLSSHLRMAGDWEQLADRLTSADFLLAKLQTGRAGIFDLLHSLQHALRGTPKLPDAHEKRSAINTILGALRPHTEAIADDPFLALQLIRNDTPARAATSADQPGRQRDLRDDPWFKDLSAIMLAEQRAGRAWLKTRHPSAQAGVRPERVLRHRNSVLSLAFAPRTDVCVLASIGADHRLRIWQDGAPPLHLELPGSDRAVCASPTGEARKRPATAFPPVGVAFINGPNPGGRIAVASASSIYFLDSWEPGVSADDFSEPAGVSPGQMHSLAALPGGLILAGDKDGSARVWDSGLRRVVARLHAPKSSKKRAVFDGASDLCCVALSPDGTRAAVSHADQSITVWKLEVESYFARLRGDAPVVLAEAEAWPHLAATPEHHLPPPGDRRVDALAFSPDGKLLAVGGGFRRGGVELWDLDASKCVCFIAHHNAVWSLAFARDTSKNAGATDWVLITGSYDRTVAIWKLSALAHTLAEHTERGHVHPRELSLHAYSYTIHELAKPLAPHVRMAHRDVVMAVAVSPDNNWLATGGYDYTVQRWDLRQLLEQPSSVRHAGGDAHASFINAGAFDPAGRWLATGSEDGTVRLWDLVSGKPGESIDLGGLAVRALRFSADGRRLAIGTLGSFAIQRLDEEGRVTGRDTQPAASATFALAFDEASGPTALVTAHADGSVFFRRAADSSRELHRHLARARAAGLSPDRRWLASVGDDRQLLITDLTGGEPLRSLAEHHRYRIKSLAFSADGRWLATGGRETIHLWDTVTWTLAATLRGHRDEIWVLDFSPDGRFLASGSRDATARVWDLSPQRRALGKSICCLPCANAVVAVRFGADSTSLRVADAGPDGGIPNIQIAELRGITVEPAASVS